MTKGHLCAFCVLLSLVWYTDFASCKLYCSSVFLSIRHTHAHYCFLCRSEPHGVVLIVKVWLISLCTCLINNDFPKLLVNYNHGQTYTSACKEIQQLPRLTMTGMNYFFIKCFFSFTWISAFVRRLDLFIHFCRHTVDQHPNLINTFWLAVFCRVKFPCICFFNLSQIAFEKRWMPFL